MTKKIIWLILLFNLIILSYWIAISNIDLFTLSQSSYWLGINLFIIFCFTNLLFYYFFKKNINKSISRKVITIIFILIGSIIIYSLLLLTYNYLVIYFTLIYGLFALIIGVIKLLPNNKLKNLN
jgi:hypothetical protein